MGSLVTRDPDILGGTPVFSGTRVPVDSLFHHLKLGYTVDYFLAQFPTVTREQAEGVLEAAGRLAQEHATLTATS
jgi:uncharacterized protein (DUF433 family)